MPKVRCLVENPQPTVTRFQPTLTANVLHLWSFLLTERRSQIVALLLLMILAALMEMATLAAVLPMLGSLVDSQAQSNNLMIGSMYLPAFITAAEDPHTVILGLTILIVCTSALTRILVLRMSTGFSASVGVELQARYFRYLLYRDYESVINDSSSKKISVVTNKIQIVISNYILGVLTGLTALIAVLGVFLMLLWLSTSVVYLVVGLLAAAYLCIAWLTRIKLKKYGRDLQIYIPQKVQCVQEGLGGFRDVTMGGSQEYFVDRLKAVAQITERASARFNFYNGFPRPLIEAICISAVAAVAWLAHRGILSGEHLLPTLGVFALGMLRLLPFFQQLFAQWARLLNGQLILAELIDGMLTPLTAATSATQSAEKFSQTIPFALKIAMENVSFSYRGVEQPALQNLNFSFDKGAYIGIVGPTGSGKSTLVDILMGMLSPTSGTLRIDGIPLISSDRNRWRRQVAHVPQKIFLSDDTVLNNIAFATSDSLVDRDRVELCASQACIHDFVKTLPDGYETNVGEDGVRLSGGQRQRIGIARALYSGCKILVFDEATNALDEETEKAVIGGLLKPDQGYTIVCVTHNISSVSQCHRVLMIEHGAARWKL